jgi:hypothetical protein
MIARTMRYPILAALLIAPVATFAQARPDSTKAGSKTAAAPATQTKAPVTQTKAPVTQTKAPVTQTKAPVTQTKAPATQTKAPATQTKTAPATQTKTPATQTKAPVTETKAPATQTKTPPAGQAKAAAPPVTGRGTAATPATVGGTTTTPPGGRGAPQAAPRDTAIPMVMMREVFDYSRDGRRDPFISLLTTTDLRPSIGDLKLLMTIVDEPGRSVALVQDAYDKKQKTLRVGSRLGRMRVSSIRADAVILTIEEFGMNRRDSLLLRDSTKARGR